MSSIRLPRALLTGADGMVGRALRDALVHAGAEYGTTARHALTESTVPTWHWEIDAQEAPQSLVEWCPRLIIHAAAMTDVDACETDTTRAFASNVTGTRRVADLARRCGAKLVYLSTDSVFDGVKGRYLDSDVPNPLNYYASTKLDGERSALTIPGALVARFNVVGNARLTRWILDSAAAGSSIDVFEDVVFSPIESRLLAAILLRLSVAAEGVIHLAGDEAVSKAEFAERLVRRAGLAASAHMRHVQLGDQSTRSGARRPLNTSLVPSTVVRDIVGVPSLDSTIARVAADYSNSIGRNDGRPVDPGSSSESHP